jgi:hypothetical protein
MMILHGPGSRSRRPRDFASRSLRHRRRTVDSNSGTAHDSLRVGLRLPDDLLFGLGHSLCLCLVSGDCVGLGRSCCFGDCAGSGGTSFERIGDH